MTTAIGSRPPLSGSTLQINVDPHKTINHVIKLIVTSTFMSFGIYYLQRTLPESLRDLFVTTTSGSGLILFCSVLVANLVHEHFRSL